MTTTTRTMSDPPALVAIAIAARKSHDRDLKHAALRDTHGPRLSFARRPTRQEAAR